MQVGYPQKWIAGADEVGRGCIAGPVVAAALVLPKKIHWKENSWLAEVKDSKLLKPAIREKLVPLIEKWVLTSAVGWASVEEIDQLNIFHATHLAICRAVKKLNIVPEHLLIDGKFIPKTHLPCPASAIVQGDRRCLSIGMASILAKVWRDQYMVCLDREYPGYELARHKGYPTLLHQKCIQEKGLAQIHRRSFRILKKIEA